MAGTVLSGDPVLAETERLLAEVERLCTQSPVVLVTDDLQWADEASLLVWQRLARAVGQLPLLLAGTYRPVPAREQVSRLRGEVLAVGGVVLSLGPLPPEHVPELVAHVAGARPGPRLAAAVRAAGGNPLYVRELVDALVREGRVAVDEGTAELTAQAPSVRVPALLGGGDRGTAERVAGGDGDGAAMGDGARPGVPDDRPRNGDQPEQAPTSRACSMPRWPAVW